MTLRPEDFVVTWKTDVPEQDKPATYMEIIQAMERLNEKTRHADPTTIVELTLRSPVAVKVAEGINQLNPGTAAVDIGQDPRFVPEKGGYQSRLSVAQTRGRMVEYIEDF